MFLSCRVHVSELIHALELPECQGAPCSKKRHDIWSLSDCNGTLTHNHLVRKQTLDHLAKLAIGSKHDFIADNPYFGNSFPDQFYKVPDF